MLSVSVIVRPKRLRKMSPTVEVLVEAPPPFLRRRRRQLPSLAPFVSARIRRARSTTGRSTIVPSRATARGPRASRSRTPRRSAGPRELALARGEDAVDVVDLGRMDARLAAKAERAREPALLPRARPRPHVEVDEVERRRGSRPRSSRSRASSGRRGSPARPAAARARARPEVDGAQEERGDARAEPSRRPAAGPAPSRRSRHRRAVRPERGDRLGRRLRQHERVEREARDEREVPSNYGVPAPLTRTSARPCQPRRRPRDDARAPPSRAGATASSRSATTASAPECERPRSLRSSLPGAKRSERSARGHGVARLCQTFGEVSNPAP